MMIIGVDYHPSLSTEGHLTLQRVSDLAVCDVPTMEV